MKLTVIVANNWEPLEFRDKNNEFVSRILEILNEAQKKSNEVLFYGTELSEKNIDEFNKELWSWTSLIQNTWDDTYNVAFGNGKHLKFIKMSSPVWSKFVDNTQWVIAYSNNGEDSYVWSLQHLENRKLHQFKKFVDRVGLFSEWSVDVPLHEFHTWYFKIYSNKMINALLKPFVGNKIPPQIFVDVVRNAHLYPIASSDPVLQSSKYFEWIHTFVWESLNSSTTVRVEPPIWDTKSTLITTMKW